MREGHPRDSELAGLSGESFDDGILEHVRCCARCRSVVADYDWLQEELAGTLTRVVSDVAVPRSAWWELQDRLLESSRRQSVRIQLSAVVGAAMVVCLLLCVPGFIRPAAAAQALQPEASLRPTPMVVAEPAGVCGRSLPATTSAVVTVPRPASHSQSSPAPALVPLPTPPDSEP
jgi:hypothetical protein